MGLNKNDVFLGSIGFLGPLIMKNAEKAKKQEGQTLFKLATRIIINHLSSAAV